MVSAKKASGQPNREELLQLAIRAAKNNQTDGARVMLRQILQQDNRNERAMMWLAKLAHSQKERKHWLRQVLVVNPDNEIAMRKLEDMEYNQSAQMNRTLLMVGLSVAAVVLVLVVIFILVAVAAR